MDTKLRFRHALLAAVLGAVGVSGTALAVDEIEPNHPISSAQPLSISSGVVASIGGTAIGTGGATVNGVIGNLTGAAVLDVDFYSFQGQVGDVVSLDIDGGMGGSRDVDTVLTVFQVVFDSEGRKSYLKLRENDDGGTFDPGTTHPFDSRITNFTLPATGTYIVGVSSNPCFLRNDGTCTSSSQGTRTNGDYTLVITGVTSPVVHINIEIKPGSGDLAPVNPKARGKIPVALLSSSEFNALDVDTTSLTFGATGYEPSLSKCAKAGEDVNGDGLLDMVCHFENQVAHFQPGDLEGIVRGKTADGREIEGHGLLKVVPVKRQN